MSGVPVDAAKFVAYMLSGLFAAIGGLFLTFVTYSGEASAANGGHLHALFDRRGGARRGLAVRRLGQRDRRDLRRADVPHHRRPAVRVRSRSALAAAVPGRWFCSRRCASAPRGSSRSATAWSCSVSSERSRDSPGGAQARASTGRSRSPSPASSSLLLVGSLYSRSFLSPEYLLQQLKVASFLGVIATGTMMVILLGQIDLSVPWAVAVGGMMSTRGDRLGPGRRDLIAIPFGVALRRCARARQRRRRRLSAHSLDDHHARGQRGRAGADGRPHRRLLAAGFVLAGDADARDRRRLLRRAQRADRLGGGRRRRDLPAQPHDLRPRRLRRSATGSARPISPASTRNESC